MNMDKIKKSVAIFAFFLALSCSSEEGTGTLTVEIWGEEYIEEGIPEDEFSDGWSVVFSKFLVSVGKITVAEEGGTPEVDEAGLKVYDLTRAGPTPIAIMEVPAGQYTHTAYTVAPSSSLEAGNASLDDVTLMEDSGYSVYIEGTADDGEGVSKTFAWGFDTDTTYDPCESSGDVPDGGSAVVQLTIHGDHLFYDDLFHEEPNVAFATLAAADSDSDGEVEEGELAAFDISTLDRYQVGSTGIDNLWDFISFLTGTLGHIDGEGHCHTH